MKIVCGKKGVKNGNHPHIPRTYTGWNIMPIPTAPIDHYASSRKLENHDSVQFFPCPSRASYAASPIKMFYALAPSPSPQHHLVQRPSFSHRCNAYDLCDRGVLERPRDLFVFHLLCESTDRTWSLDFAEISEFKWKISLRPVFSAPVQISTCWCVSKWILQFTGTQPVSRWNLEIHIFENIWFLVFVLHANWIAVTREIRIYFWIISYFIQYIDTMKYMLKSI